MNSILKFLLIVLGGVTSTAVLTALFYPYIEDHTSRVVDEVYETSLHASNRLPLTQHATTVFAEAMIDALEKEDYDLAYKAICLHLISVGAIGEVSGDEGNIEFINSVKDRQLVVLNKIEEKLGSGCLTNQ